MSVFALWNRVFKRQESLYFDASVVSRLEPNQDNIRSRYVIKPKLCIKLLYYPSFIWGHLRKMETSANVAAVVF